MLGKMLMDWELAKKGNIKLRSRLYHINDKNDQQADLVGTHVMEEPTHIISK